MNIKDCYVCPRCQAAGQIQAIQNLMEDVRYDVVTCPQCGVEWRVYYKTSEASTEVMFAPEPDRAPEENQAVEEPVECKEPCEACDCENVG